MKTKNPVHIFHSEPIILEKSQDKKVHHYREDQVNGGGRLSAAAPLDIHTAHIVKADGKDHQENIDRFSPCVEDKASGQQYKILEFSGDNIINQQHGRQKCKNKKDTAEYHSCFLILSYCCR